ncbi:MAG: hypothetical protein AB1791_14555, partial [Chloroflexota bacterium]
MAANCPEGLCYYRAKRAGAKIAIPAGQQLFFEEVTPTEYELQPIPPAVINDYFTWLSGIEVGRIDAERCLALWRQSTPTAAATRRPATPTLAPTPTTVLPPTAIPTRPPNPTPTSVP